MGKRGISFRFALRFVRGISLIAVCALLLFGTGVEGYDAITSVPNCENKIALTFDDGPSALYTAKILDILNKYDVKATFFIIGENAEQNPELVEREISEGHELGNHTWTHPHMNGCDIKRLCEELNKTKNFLSEKFNYTPKLFRPPEGFCCKTVQKCADKFGYDIVLWDIDTTDWAHNSVGNIVKAAFGAKSGDIILCHDYVTKPSPTPEALEKFIPELKSRGYSFVTVSELLSAKN